MKKRNIFLSLLLIPLLIGCKGKEITGDDQPLGPIDFEPKVTFKEIDKEEYLNKTLAGLLGQFAGFLSGYEFVSSTNPVGLPLNGLILLMVLTLETGNIIRLLILINIIV